MSIQRRLCLQSVQGYSCKPKRFFFCAKSFSKKSKYLIKCRNQKACFNLSYFYSFGSSFQSHPQWVTLQYMPQKTATSRNQSQRQVRLDWDYVELPKWSEHDQSTQVALGRVRSGYNRLYNWSGHDQSPQVELGQVRSGQVGLLNWPHTDLNLTSPLRSDLVKIGRVTSGYLTCLKITSPRRSGKARLGRVRLGQVRFSRLGQLN